jgi:hypothetical protein
MARRSRLETGSEEGESYYISMTDMMVGVVFIFIILLGYFASQFHATTSELLRSDDPRTTVLLQTATNLERSVQPVEIDYAQRVVCLPTSFLRVEAQAGREAQPRRCFSYAEPKVDEAEVRREVASTARVKLTEQLSTQIAAPAETMTVNTGEGILIFDADRVFRPGTDVLSGTGEQIVASAAGALARTLPCRGYLEGFDRAACGDKTDRLAMVNVLARANFDAFSDEGRAAYALAVRRSVAFHRALTDAQPVLGRVRSGEAADSPPLLRVASLGQSTSAEASGQGGTISIQFDMAL